MTVDALAGPRPPPSALAIHVADMALGLAALMRDGQGNTDQANDVREAIGSVWWLLSVDEISLLDSLSGELYALDGTEFLYRTRGNESAEEAFAAGDWRAVLARLRQAEPHVENARRAELRALAYEALGYVRVADVFRAPVA